MWSSFAGGQGGDKALYGFAGLPTILQFKASVFIMFIHYLYI
jgi:hypothetical protein